MSLDACTTETSNFILKIENFHLKRQNILFSDNELKQKTIIKKHNIAGYKINQYINEFWTSKQRQANSIHEISYRACFKPQLPKFFIKYLSKRKDYVYDPFLGRGTTLIESALLGRKVIGNDVNPLSKILTEPRLKIPKFSALKDYINSIAINYDLKAEIDLSMFYHSKTESEILSFKEYILAKEKNNRLSDMDKWIRMIITNRLTGHSKGFFSVYTMPPNQAISPERQIKINRERQQKPSYRNTKELILKKTKSLIKDITHKQQQLLSVVSDSAIFFNDDAQKVKISDNFVQLTITSPPFLDVVKYAQDNWLRCWFNGIDSNVIAKKITMSKTLKQWTNKMQNVFDELYRITKKRGYVVFEVGEVRGGKLKLDDYIVPIGIKSKFKAINIIINKQEFSKTSNIWGVKNNHKGTNSNRIVIFQKM